MKQLFPESIIRKKNKYAGLFLMALIIATFSFPELDFTFNIGFDTPLKWLYNYLFAEGLRLGQGIISPHGPLAFFMYPLSENFLLATIVTVFLQFVFVFQLFFLIGENKKIYWLLTAVLAWFIFSLSNFNQLVILNVSIAYLLYLKDGKPANKYWGLLLTAFALYIKAWLVIITGTLTFSLLIIDFFRNKNYKRTLTDIAAILVLMLLLWLVMYGRPGGFWDYLIGMFHLAGYNSAATAYHPKNNWFLVVPLLLVVFLTPFLQKNKEGRTFGFLFFLSFFAAWKYWMALEDYFHMLTYLFFICVSMILFVIYNRKNLWVNIPVIVVATILFMLNMKNVEESGPISFHYSGIGNFVKFVSSYSEIKEKSEEQNRDNITSNRLPEEIRNKIADSTVDVYPWDYTIVAANNLNWKARPIIQSYEAYTSWHDQKNANHFSSNDAPEYFIFDLNKVTRDLNGGKLESIDNRYLLNDEPQTLIGIIRNYRRIYSDKNFLVYCKREQSLELPSVKTKAQQGKCHEWIAVPDSAGCFTRLKLHLNKSFLGTIKSFLYKDELYVVYYKTSDGNTFEYRFIPQNADGGIWVAPFYTSAGDQVPAEKITEVMLSCSNKDMVRNPFRFEWEYFNAEESLMNDFFGKDSLVTPIVYLKEGFDFDSDNEKWEGYNAQKVVNYSYYKQKAYRVDPGKFSPSFIFNTDTLPCLPARITVECWLKTYPGASANLVIETENATGKKNWFGKEINWQIININEQNRIFTYQDLTDPGVKVTVYLWNNGGKSVMVYGLDVTVKENRQE